jgi:hypothetical protein
MWYCIGDPIHFLKFFYCHFSLLLFKYFLNKYEIKIKLKLKKRKKKRKKRRNNIDVTGQ